MYVYRIVSLSVHLFYKIVVRKKLINTHMRVKLLYINANLPRWDVSIVNNVDAMMFHDATVSMWTCRGGMYPV